MPVDKVVSGLIAATYDGRDRCSQFPTYHIEFPHQPIHSITRLRSQELTADCQTSDTHQRQALVYRLSDQQSIERIVVVTFEILDATDSVPPTASENQVSRNVLHSILRQGNLCG